MTRKREVVPVSSLVEDFDFYPRHVVDSANVARLVHAIEAGTTIPPVVADRASRRIVDGFHRCRAMLRIGGNSADISVEWRDYDTDAAMFIDAVRLNNGQGKPLSPFDQARCVTLFGKMGVDPDMQAAALSLTKTRVAELDMRKTAFAHHGPAIPIKNTVRHLAGQSLTDRQLEGARRVGGMSPVYYVNQTINLLENDLIDQDNDRLADRLHHLALLLQGWVKRAA